MTLPLPPKPAHEGNMTPDEREAYLRTLRVDGCQCSACFLLGRLDQLRATLQRVAELPERWGSRSLDGSWAYEQEVEEALQPPELEQPEGYGYRTLDVTSRTVSYDVQVGPATLEVPGDPIPEWPARVAEEPDGRVIYANQPPHAAGESGRPSRAAARCSCGGVRLWSAFCPVHGVDRG